MLSDKEIVFLERAIGIAGEGMRAGKGGPFGCVIVKDGLILAEGCNQVVTDNDPTAHAEIVAIRSACKQLNNFQLDGCDIYASCEPCPMCLGAIYWARANRVIYAATRQDAAGADFDDDFIYKELAVDIHQRQIKFLHYPHPAAQKVFKEWIASEKKTPY